MLVLLFPTFLDILMLTDFNNMKFGLKLLTKFLIE